MSDKQESETSGRLLVGWLVLAAIPFWALVGVLSSLTFQAVMGPHRMPPREIRVHAAEPLPTEPRPIRPCEATRSRCGCGRLNLNVAPPWMGSERRVPPYPRRAYYYAPGIQPIGLARTP